MEGIQQMFAEFDGYDTYDAQLAIWCVLKHQSEIDRIASRTPHQWASIKAAAKRWQSTHRDVLRESDRKWRASLPADECWCRAKRVPGRKLCQMHLEKERERARANKAKRQEARAA